MIQVIPRSHHEVYFIPFDKNTPKKKEIGLFLKTHHPCHASSGMVDSLRCRINGQNYQMITVLHQSLTVNALRKIRTRYVTVSAVLAKSGYAEKECSVSCMAEFIGFRGVPESIYLPSTKGMPVHADYALEGSEALLSLIKKEKIKVSLFRTKWEKPASLIGVLTVVLSLILLFGSYSNQKNEMKSVSAVEELASPEKITADFWTLFIGEISAMEKAGGIIREYRYDYGSSPTNTLQIEKCDPLAVQSEIIKINGFSDLQNPEISVRDTDLCFSLRYTAMTDAQEKTDNRNVFADVRDFKACCSKYSYPISEISINGNAEYTLSINQNRLSAFLSCMVQYSSENGKKIRLLHISRINSLPDFQIKTSFISSDGYSPKLVPASSAVNKVFAVSSVTPKKNSVHKTEIGESVGKIQISPSSSIVFLKSDNGKFQIIRRGK